MLRFQEQADRKSDRYFASVSSVTDRERAAWVNETPSEFDKLVNTNRRRRRAHTKSYACMQSRAEQSPNHTE
jgi:hypothetical protein